MPNFTIEMEFYGHKLRTTLRAENEFRAEQMVRKRLVILSITEDANKKPDDIPQFMSHVFKGFKLT